MISQVIFFLFAAIAVVSALLVILQKNAMHSVMYLAFTVLAVAGVFFSLQAEYLGAIQILVYGGGIVVLYIFVIIIVNLKDVMPERRNLVPRLFIVGIPLLLLAEVGTVLIRNKISFAPGDAQGLELRHLAEMLFTTYLVPFEIASVLLLAVLIGAIIIARRKLYHDPD